jgi:hypothetical protein
MVYIVSSSFRFALFISLCVPYLCHAAASATVSVPQVGRLVNNPVTSVYENATITEDVSLRGVVAVKGSLTVAPQATLRIEPGTEIRFSAGRGNRQLPRLVVMGRIQAVGSLDRPILFTSAATSPDKKGAWGGIVLLSSEKRNQLEHCRVEGADIALEGRFSSFSLKSVAITSSIIGISLQDSNAVIGVSSVSGCETGIEARDSELELKDSAIAQNRRGVVLSRSSVVMSSVTLTGNSQYGILAEEGRLKLTSGEVSGNGIGAYIKGGEGQLFMSVFEKNSDTALHLVSARLKVNRCRITDNLRDALKLDGDRSAIWGNSISGNGGYNIVNAGSANVSALQNWWGAGDEASVKSKIFDIARDGRSGLVHVYPWLLEKPALLP